MTMHDLMSDARTRVRADVPRQVWGAVLQNELIHAVGKFAGSAADDPIAVAPHIACGILGPGSYVTSQTAESRLSARHAADTVQVPCGCGGRAAPASPSFRRMGDDAGYTRCSLGVWPSVSRPVGV
ncbi:hypothetical protein PAA8504_00370 [Palleronia abyssalis]|uniref:Uncharacterized protein n=1 Tax=Palleronia abyssalis TaxID=1501240 RepID=A0A2R8BR28_9RHOB|nr:hypothetical protein PAA8504_00370 [Palleronia abyssalis]